MPQVGISNHSVPRLRGLRAPDVVTAGREGDVPPRPGHSDRDRLPAEADRNPRT